MKNKFITTLIFTALSALASNAYADDNIDDLDIYAGDDEVELTPIEQQALELSQKVQERQQIPVSEAGNGYVQFVYGAQKASVVCAILRICDIQLQPSEAVQEVFIGDSARWSIEPASVGEGGLYSTAHIIVKPLDTNIKTNLVVTTDRRIYHINLTATKDQWMPQVSFVYPEDAMAKFKAKQKQEKQEVYKKTTPEGEYLGNLDFKYEITGDQTVWYPVRVYNDGKKTIIEMPKAMESNEAPAFVVTKYNKDSKSTEQLVNYRVQKNKYIVDSLFFEGELIAGVGSDQTKVTIRRGTK